MTATIIGFALRYIPKLFGFAGDALKAKQDRKDEERMVRLQFELEQKKSEMVGKQAILQGEITEALAGIQHEITELSESMKDRKSARSYGVKLASLMDQTLARGKDLGVPTWLIGIGWCGVLFVEMVSASVQAFIAIATLAMWMHYKIRMGELTWTVHDWWLMETVVGFYLAGRVQKHEKTNGAGNSKCQTMN